MFLFLRLDRLKLLLILFDTKQYSNDKLAILYIIIFFSSFSQSKKLFIIFISSSFSKSISLTLNFSSMEISFFSNFENPLIST